MHRDPTAGKECSETAPDDIPYVPVVQVTVTDSTEKSFTSCSDRDIDVATVTDVVVKVNE